jgi:hypothetical protein
MAEEEPAHVAFHWESTADFWNRSVQPQPTIVLFDLLRTDLLTTRLAVPLLRCMVQFLHIESRVALSRACRATRSVAWQWQWSDPDLLWTTAAKLIYGDTTRTPSFTARHHSEQPVNWNKAARLIATAQRLKWTPRLDDLAGALAGERCEWTRSMSSVLIDRCIQRCSKSVRIASKKISCPSKVAPTDVSLCLDGVQRDLPWGAIWCCYAQLSKHTWLPWLPKEGLTRRILELQGHMQNVSVWMQANTGCCGTRRWIWGLAQYWYCRLARLSILLRRLLEPPTGFELYDVEIASINAYRCALRAGVSLPIAPELDPKSIVHHSNDHVHRTVCCLDCIDEAALTNSPRWLALAATEVRRNSLKLYNGADALNTFECLIRRASKQGLVSAWIVRYSIEAQSYSRSASPRFSERSNAMRRILWRLWRLGSNRAFRDLGICVDESLEYELKHGRRRMDQQLAGSSKVQAEQPKSYRLQASSVSATSSCCCVQ